MNRPVVTTDSKPPTLPKNKSCPSKGRGRHPSIRYSTMPNGPIAVTGATGYIGGRLVPRLLDAGYTVHCLVRSSRKLQDRPWSAHPNLVVIQLDFSDEKALLGALKGCTVAYYLVHSMISAGKEYADHDLKLATTFANAARQAGVE